jgi:Glycosyl hydrolase family 81 C-terminal domain
VCAECVHCIRFAALHTAVVCTARSSVCFLYHLHCCVMTLITVTADTCVHSNCFCTNHFEQAVNAYYAVQLFGLATGNDKLTQWGRVLTQMELRAGRKYWQMPSDGEVYDSIFASNKVLLLLLIFWGAIMHICSRLSAHTRQPLFYY